MSVMEELQVASTVLLAMLITLWSLYLNFHVWAVRAAGDYVAPKGYLRRIPVVVFHIPVRGEHPSLLERVLASIKQLKYPRDRLKVVVVCDDEDPEPMMSVCREAQRDLEVVFIHRRRPKGFKAGALNEALKVDSDVVVVLDVDSLVPHDFLVKSIPILMSSRDVAAVVARWEPLNPNESLISEAISFGQTFFTRRLFRGLQVRLKSSVLVGNACLIKRDLLIAAGGWDERCILEDVELGVRFRVRGYRVVYNDDVAAWVEHPSTYGDFKKQQKRWACGASQVLLKHARNVLRSRMSLLEKMSFMVYLTQYWGVSLMGLSLPLLPVLAFLGGEPMLIPLMPFLALGLATAVIYGYSFAKFHIASGARLIRTVKAMGRATAITAAMSMDILASSLRPLFKLKCFWRVTPKGPAKSGVRGIPRLEASLMILPALGFVASMLTKCLVLAAWSLVSLAPLAYVVVKRFS